MIYSNTDIILCFEGIGRTFYYKTGSNSSFAMDVDPDGKDLAKFIDGIIETKNLKRYRYILLPMDLEIKALLDSRKVSYVVARPDMDDKSEWIRRWWKSNATAEQIKSRIAEFERFDTEESGGSWKDVPTILLKSDEWLGNILSQNPNEVAKE